MHFNTKHGLSGTAEHRVWAQMRSRCSNKRHAAYKRYGGRGIVVDPLWDSFETFLADMGCRPSPEHTLDRIDNDGPYSPDNCRWAEMGVQNKNRSTSIVISFAGETLSLMEWSKKLGIAYDTLLARVKRGLPLERALLPRKLHKSD